MCFHSETWNSPHVFPGGSCDHLFHSKWNESRPFPTTCVWMITERNVLDYILFTWLHSYSMCKKGGYCHAPGQVSHWGEYLTGSELCQVIYFTAVVSPEQSLLILGVKEKRSFTWASQNSALRLNLDMRATEITVICGSVEGLNYWASSLH